MSSGWSSDDQTDDENRAETLFGPNWRWVLGGYAVLIVLLIFSFSRGITEPVRCLSISPEEVAQSVTQGVTKMGGRSILGTILILALLGLVGYVIYVKGYQHSDIQIGNYTF